MATLQRIDGAVVVVELPEGGRGRVVLDSAASSATPCRCRYGRSNGFLQRSCIDDGVYADVLNVPHDRDSTSPRRRPNRGKIVGKARGGGIVAFS